MSLCGPKFLRNRANRAAQAATAEWLFRVVFIGGVYIHIGKQGDDSETRRLAPEIKDLLELEPGTTPGPWEPHPDFPTMLVNISQKMAVTMTPGKPDDHTSEDVANRRLIAAAPDMRATIAAQTWEYGVEVRPDEDSEWLRIGPWWLTVEKARAYRGRAILRLGTPYSHDRVIRRPVGPVEVVE